jgi:Zn finger protein HypA/HybF involved in hydrogenase expression
MHEHGVGDLILRDLKDRFSAVPPGGYLYARVRVSEISGLTAEALQTAMDHAQEQHETPPIQLEILAEWLLGRCLACGEVTTVGKELVCRLCQSDTVSLCGGETVLIEEVKFVPAGEPGTG